jgi:hypothetical protein
MKSLEFLNYVFMLASFFSCKVLQALESTLLHIQLVEHTFYPEVKGSEREDDLSYRSATKAYSALNFIPKSHRENYTVCFLLSNVAMVTHNKIIWRPRRQDRTRPRCQSTSLCSQWYALNYVTTSCKSVTSLPLGPLCYCKHFARMFTMAP